jgi:hypothetical protein
MKVRGGVSHSCFDRVSSQHPRAKKRFGSVGAAFSAGVESAQLSENAKRLVRELGSGGGDSLYRNTLVAELTEGFKPTCAAELLEVPVSVVKNAKSKAKKLAEQGVLPPLMSAGHSVSKIVARTRAGSLDPELLAFFRSKTIERLQSLGRPTTTVVLPMTREALYRSLYVEFPKLVRHAMACNSIHSIVVIRFEASWCAREHAQIL